MPSRRTYLAGIAGTLGFAAGCISPGSPNHDRLEWSQSLSGVLLFDNGTLYQSSHNDLATRAVAPADGSTQWTVSFDDSDFDEHLCFGGPLAIDGQRVYVPGCDGLRALRRADGEILWKTDSEVNVPPGVADGTVYVNTGDLVAIDAEEATRLWSVSISGEGRTVPAVGQQTVVVTNRSDGVVVAVDLDGDERWRYQTDAETRSPTIANETVYVASTDNPATGPGTFTALSVTDGNVEWSVETPNVKRGTRPVVGEEQVYLGCSGRDEGQLVALARDDGTRRWSHSDENSTVYQPVVAGDSVYAGSNDNALYAFTRDGTQKWQAETRSVVGTVTAGPDHVYASNHSHLMAYRRD